MPTPNGRYVFALYGDDQWAEVGVTKEERQERWERYLNETTEEQKRDFLRGLVEFAFRPDEDEEEDDGRRGDEG